MENSKVVFGNETLIDLTGDTVEASKMAAGTTAHDAAGNLITGTATEVDLVQETGDSETAVMSQAAVTAELEKQVEEIVDIKAQGVQQSPLFANSIEECTDTEKLYVLPDGHIYAYLYQKISQKNYTNVVPSSTERNSTEIYNGGLGYKNGYRLSGGNETATSGTGYVTTGLFPYAKKSDGLFPSVYIKGAEASTSRAYFRGAFFTSDRNTLVGSGISSWSSFFTVETLDANSLYYKLTPVSGGIADNVAFFRLSLYGSGENLIISVDNPIEDIEIDGYSWTKTNREFIPADYEDRIVALENAVENDTDTDLAYYSEVGKGGVVTNGVNANNELWNMWDSRLAFGIPIDTAKVPYRVNGMAFVDGTLMLHNNGTYAQNRWKFHLLEGYSKDNYSRATMLIDKHEAETNGKNCLEFYLYTGASHSASAYANVKIGSDVQYHSFNFDRDKLTAWGEIDNKMPITLARISLANDIDSTYETIAQADSAYEPESYYEENNKCLKYIALKNAENGAMFYDTDRNKPVMKINGQWCEIPFTPITDSAYDIL